MEIATANPAPRLERPQVLCLERPDIARKEVINIAQPAIVPPTSDEADRRTLFAVATRSADSMGIALHSGQEAMPFLSWIDLLLHQDVLHALGRIVSEGGF